MYRALFVLTTIAGVLLFLTPSSCYDEKDMSNVFQLTNENFKEVVLANDTGVVFIRCHLP